MKPDLFKRWMRRYGLTLDAAAEATGYSRRQIANFRDGTTAIGARQRTVIEAAAKALKPVR